ncbi:hypothetical protein GCM10028864_38050 [Microlunatus parietis]
MRVVGVEPAEAGQLVVDPDRATGRRQPLRERVQIPDPDRRVGLAGRPEVVLDAEVQFVAGAAEPAAAAGGERGRLRDLGQAEQVGVVRAGGGLGVGRAGEQDVVQHDHRLS